MPDELICCPSCNHQLRVPSELLGQPVECPQCHSQFTAPIRRENPPPLPAEPPIVRPASSTLDPNYAPPYADDPEARSHQAKSVLMAPAICLLVMSALAGLMNAYVITSGLYFQANPDEWERQVQAEMDKHPELGPGDRQKFEAMLSAGNITPWMVLPGGTSLLAAALTALGAIAMLTRRAYWLAVLGAIAALNPINCCCLDLNVPFGIWALIVLLGSDVRAAFR